MQKLISLEQARQIIMEIEPLAAEKKSLQAGCNRVIAADICAISDCPSVDSSLKDGYALVADDIQHASREKPVELSVQATVTAGQNKNAHRVVPGSAIRIMTGAAIPAGANAVLASEFAKETGDTVVAFRDAHAGRNILQHGSDVQAGEIVIKSGTKLTPTHLGLLAAAGVSNFSVHRLPRVVVAATGSELVAPGIAIEPGKVAASNMVTLQAELKMAGMNADTLLIRDNLEQLQNQLGPLFDRYDVVLTCGGVLDGDKDLTIKAMDALGVEPVFRRCRIGPGKGISFGKKGKTLVCNLPGGPPSNHVAFLLLALPAIRRLCGWMAPLGNKDEAVVTDSVKGQEGWTQLVYGILEKDLPGVVRPLHRCSRLKAMAKADCLIELPENVRELESGERSIIWKIR